MPKKTVTTRYQRVVGHSGAPEPGYQRRPIKVEMMKPRDLSPLAQYVEDHPELSTRDALLKFQQEECTHKTMVVTAQAGHYGTVTQFLSCSECGLVKTKGKNVASR